MMNWFDDIDEFPFDLFQLLRSKYTSYSRTVLLLRLSVDVNNNRITIITIIIITFDVNNNGNIADGRIVS